jgi:hypothetical protein
MQSSTATGFAIRRAKALCGEPAGKSPSSGSAAYSRELANYLGYYEKTPYVLLKELE